MDGQRPRCEGLHGIEHRRQGVVLHLHQGRGLFSTRMALRGHCRHHLTGEPHLLHRQDGHIADRATKAQTGDIGTRQHAAHPRDLPGLLDVDGDDARVGIRASHHRDVE